MADDDLQTVRARLGVHFDKDKSIRDQCLFSAMCLALPYAHEGRATKIDIAVDGDDITITDDGPGVALGNDPSTGNPVAQDMMSTLKACASHKPSPRYGDLLCGISLAEVNAISSSGSIVTMVDGVAYAQKYILGAPSAPFKEVNRESPGTRVRFSLDKRWAGRREFDIVAVENQVRRLGLDLSNTTLTFSQT